MQKKFEHFQNMITGVTSVDLRGPLSIQNICLICQHFIKFNPKYFSKFLNLLSIKNIVPNFMNFYNEEAEGRQSIFNIPTFLLKRRMYGFQGVLCRQF